MDDYTYNDALLKADEKKNDTPIIKCRSYQHAFFEEIMSFCFEQMLENDPYLEEHEGVFLCLTLVEDCVDKYVGKIR